MTKYAIHFWDKTVEARMVDEESAGIILKAKSEGGMFELAGGFFEGSAVWAVIPQKRDLQLAQIEAPKEKPASREVIEKVTADLKKKGLLHSTKE